MSDPLRTAAEAALALADDWWPADVFIGGGYSDDGVNRIVAVREALRAALAQPRPNPTAYGTDTITFSVDTPKSLGVCDEDSAIATMIASEPALARDWDTPEEDATWKHLEAQPAGGWQPVEGTIPCEGDVTIDADRIAITIGFQNTALATAQPPPTVRLCEWVEPPPAIYPEGSRQAFEEPSEMEELKHVYGE